MAEPVIQVGQVWRRSRTGTLLRVLTLHEPTTSSDTGPDLEVEWESYPAGGRSRRGSTSKAKWLRNNDLVSDIRPPAP